MSSPDLPPTFHKDALIGLATALAIVLLVIGLIGLGLEFD